MRGAHVQLIEIPGITGRVVTDLYACDPPMVQVVWDGGGIGVIETSRVERVVFDVASQEWVREEANQERQPGYGWAGIFM